MKRTLIFNIKNIKTSISLLVEQLIINRQKVILTVLSVFGLWCGTKIYVNNNSTLNELLSSCLDLFINQRRVFAVIVLIIINITPILLSFFNGFFTFGMPLTVLCPCLQGILIGLINAWTFNNYKLNGIFFSLLSIIPFCIIILLMLLVSCDGSISVSKQIAKSVFLSENGDRGEVKLYFIRHIIIIAVTILITCLQYLLIVNLCNKLLV